MSDEMFSVEMNVPGDREWCEQAEAGLASWRAGMEASPQAAAVAVLPEVELEDHGGCSALELHWASLPAENAWQAVERARDVLALVFPGLEATPAVRVFAYPLSAVRD